ncbi:MAG: DUF192 domain-containing protein [Halobacteriovoraceae bacterium]|nr:DUF192 domain-containing protein [Halobacteriovoraceae bacterium]
MYALITHRWLKFKVILLFFLLSCQSNIIPKEAKLALPNGKIIDISLAITFEEQKKGLSGVSKEKFNKTQGMFFFYLEDGLRQFWMPDTYFDLDMFFLDKNLRVLKVLRKVPAHPGMETPPPIFRTQPFFCRHVLEMRADSPLAAQIKKGFTLQWMGKLSLSEIESKIRRPK